jgi:hypothetical protein
VKVNCDDMTARNIIAPTGPGTAGWRAYAIGGCPMCRRRQKMEEYRSQQLRSFSIVVVSFPKSSETRQSASEAPV